MVYTDSGTLPNVGVRGNSTRIDTSFADLSNNLTFATMLHGEVLYHDSLGLLGEFNYSQLAAQASRTRASLNANSSLILSDVAVFYRFGAIPFGQGASSTVDLDLLAGARIWSLGLGMNLDANKFGKSIFKQKSWVDPIIGTRATVHLNDKWFLSLRGGVGGFSISSALTWDATALLGYAFWEHCSLVAGYRAVGVNHKEGSGSNEFLFNTTLHGPIIGLAFSF